MSELAATNDELQSRGEGRMLQVPPPQAMWFRTLLVVAVVLTYYLLDQLTFVFMDAWMLESLGLSSVFWTNFKAGLALFVWGFVGPVVSIGLPAIINPIDPIWRRIILVAAVMTGLIGGYLLAGQYLVFLQYFGSVDVGEIDPVFGNDIGFYLFRLPAVWSAWTALVIPLSLGLISSFFCSWLAGLDRATDEKGNKLVRAIDAATRPSVLISLAVIGILSAIGIWLARFDLLWNENDTAPFFNGADYVDVVGIFSYLNYYYLTAALVFISTILIVSILFSSRQAIGTQDQSTISARLPASARKLLYIVLSLAVADFAFATAVAVRDATLISPNEPVIQFPYIQRHIDGTLKGWDLENVETVALVPFGSDDPLPDAETLLESETLKNVPLWPGWVTYVERLLDPQHAERILLTQGDPTVYGPVLDVFRAQQKLRTYYDFMDIDTVRYTIDGEKRLLVSSVRELPLNDPQDWLSHWGQRTLVYTHGHGLVVASASDVSGEGEMNFITKDIPIKSDTPELSPENPAVYYGNGAGIVMAASNATGISELNFPTDEDREEVIYPTSVDAGVPVDSFVKRIVIGWRSGSPIDVWFSDLITGDTRIHYFRRPLDRIERIAPFLFLDSNITAIVDDGKIAWLVNGITTSDNYPYSWRWTLGDKSTEQHFEDRAVRLVNYARDSVKVVIDSYTGATTFYKFADEPVVNTWAGIYPDLFKSGAEMPENVRIHLQYPQELFHSQFDDIYILYHMRDPLAYFQLEDMWDDADEVLGPILSEGDAITFSIEPRHWMAETGDVFPASSDQVQYAQSMVFTNEQTINLRSIATVYQDGDDYGRKVMLQVPKGHFAYGPEQADAIIDQEPDISEQISWWNRTGSEVIRGHTSTLVIGREVLFVEPLFTRSKQNPVPQLKLVIVVFRGHAASGETLEEALRQAIEKVRRRQDGVSVVEVMEPVSRESSAAVQ
jgi:uncharacterized protein